MLERCDAIPRPWKELLATESPGWWACREPHMLLEYIVSRGWLSARRAELFSDSYMRLFPSPPVDSAARLPGGSDGGVPSEPSSPTTSTASQETPGPPEGWESDSVGSQWSVAPMGWVHS